MNKFLSKVVAYGGNMTGSHTRRIGRDLEALQRFQNLGPKGIPRSTVTHAQDLLSQAKTDSLNARVGTVAGGIVAGGGTYFGVKKYHQYLDNKILERIDRMSNMDYNQ